ncbi:hypothetical protein AL755_15530 [Arthrobacter sp. ERGS1:01]|uniref:hypothetical protein n=1 Tax=Arthrobacter sp. ERGS1:01 TaxID=1704044 RepID=UPI0006B54814|nr:hypothetical protein [Arthrobacter sp. ERGS1:01]ALE06535.1 hypothetical protein AL755_15530 [Arthrobacter sp. ERGS1:01]
MSNMPMPSYNPEWSAQPNVPAPVRPKQIGWAFQLIIAAAVLNVIAAIFGVINASSPAFRQQIADQLAKSNINTNGQDAVGMGVAFGIGSIIVAGVVGVILYIIIGIFINKGHGWARITGLVLAVISLSRLVGFTFPAGIFTILQVLAGIVAIVLCFIQPGAQFFTDRKNYKLANKIR